MAYATSTTTLNLQLPRGRRMLSTREETMEVSVSPSPTPDLERKVMAAVTASEARGDPPFVCALEVSRCCVSDESSDSGSGSVFPSAELASILVSNLCFSNNSPFMWKLLEQTMANRLVYPLQALALLTSRVIPNRRAQPEAYRLFLELIRQYSLSLSVVEAGPCRKRITKYIEGAMQLSRTYQVEEIDFGTTVVLLVFSTITTLIDCALEDYGLPFVSQSRVVNEGSQSSDLDARGKHHDHLKESNAFMALEALENISSEKKIQILLHLVYLNMPGPFNSLLQRLRFIEAHKLSTNSLAAVNHLLEKLFFNIQKAMNLEYLPNKCSILGYLLNTGSVNSPPSLLIGAVKGGCWIIIDIFMENSMERKTFCPGAVFEKLTELITTLQIINQASWQETFQALWLSALRLVQRGREPMIGPIPHLDSRMCMLLAIVPLSIAPLLKEESSTSSAGGNGILPKKQSLVACLQALRQFSNLLSPPLAMVDITNNAATKAASFVRNFKAGSGNLGMMPSNYSSVKAVGNLLHLVVEACIARDLIDTSAYFWPGYVLPSVVTKDLDLMLIHDSPWLTFMQGAPLSGPLQIALMATPATSIKELEKLNLLALNGTEEERTAASKILCGASLTRGWNIQECVVRIVVKLLSPPLLSDSPVSGDTSSYLPHMHMLSAVLSCLAHADVIHILSLYGVVSEVAAALMPLCEAFGSMPPPPSYQSSTVDEVTVYSVFSFAFLFLLRLYKFYGPAQELVISGRGGPVRPETTLDCLLLMRNNHVCNNEGHAANDTYSVHELPRHSVYIDSFPKLRNWYFQNQACVASVISGLCKSKPCHQVANMILNMIFRKINKGEVVVSVSTSMSTGAGSASTMTSSSRSESSGSVSEDSCQRPPLLPAWDMLEAIPFVLEAFLTACAYGRLSSRDLTTGLRNLVDFFPASVATITSYFSAEITRGVWKSVGMNGTEWPSPAEALYTFESEIKEVLEHVGVNIQTSYPRGTPPTLPLPLAALGSLAITFKLDKKSDYTRDVVGEALENCAAGCSWPNMLIIGSLCTQKARKWHDFVIYVATRAPFTHMKDSVAQLMHSCFKAFLGPASRDGSSLTSVRGVVGLLGQCASNNSDLHPGLLFVRTCHTFQDPHFCSEVIFKLVIEWSGKLAAEQICGSPTQLKFRHVSLAATICIVRQVAIIGASLLCVAGRALLVQILFEETVPTSLLSQHEKGPGQVESISSMLQGYAISYLMFFSTAIVWGIGANSAGCKFWSSERRARMISSHLDFIARVLEGRIVLGCDPSMWKAHVLCFVGLLVRFAPTWVTSAKLDTLRKISSGLRNWHEFDLALSLLKLGGMGAIEAVVELLF